MDTFPNAFDPAVTQDFQDYLRDLIGMCSSSSHECAPGALIKLLHFHSLLSSNTRPRMLPQAYWLAHNELQFLMMFETNHYSFLTSDPESHSHTLPGKPNWFILRYDSKSRKEDVFSLQVLEALLQRNNFAVFSDYHYYPFPFRSTSAGELDAALRSLAERLLKHFNGGTPMEHLITIYTADPQASLFNPLPRIPCHRSYHGPNSGANLTGSHLDISDSLLHSDPALSAGSFPEMQEVDNVGDAVINTLS